jgi:hypothetical protein
MLPRSNRIRLAKPFSKLFIDVVRGSQTKRMQVVPGRKRFDPPEPRTLEPTRQHDVPIEPRAPWGDLGKGHPHVKGDARLLWQHLHGPDFANRRDDGVEERTNRGRFVREVMLEIVTAARMRLIAVRELAPALGAPP